MRPQILNPLFGSLENLKGAGSRYFRLLAALCGGFRVADLLWHLPSGIVDRTYSVPLRQAQAGRIWTGTVKIVEHIVPPVKKQPYRIIVEDGSSESL